MVRRAIYFKTNLKPAMANLCPPSFTTKVIRTTSNSIIMRSNVQNFEDINKWVKEYGEMNNNHWNSRNSRKNAKTYIYWKKFVCHHSSHMKVDPEVNKRGISKNSKCPATIELKVEILSKFPKETDCFIQEGFPCHIIVDNCHNHSLNTAEALRLLPAADCCKETFLEYFDRGMGAAESCRYHESVLQLQEGFNEMQLANSQINPTYRSVQHWHKQWCLSNLGPRSGIDMIEDFLEVSMELDNDPPPQELPTIQPQPLVEDEENVSRRENLIKEFGDTLRKFKSSTPAMKKALLRLRSIRSKGQCETMLNTLGANIPRRRKAGSTIRVQPT